MKRILAGLWLVLSGGILLAAPAGEAPAEEREEQRAERIISIGGSITEIIYELEEEDRLAAVDDTSLYPSGALERFPSVGYVRRLSSENILALKPDLIITSNDAGPPEVVDQLKAAGTAMEFVNFDNSVESTLGAIEAVGRILGVEEKAEALERRVRREIEEAQAVIDTSGGAEKTVAFVYARGAGTLMIAGENSSGSAIISLAGGTPAVTEYEGYKPLTPEALVDKNPAYLLFTSTGLESLGGVEGLSLIPGLQELDAVKQGSIIAVEDLLLLGFGPRLGLAIDELSSKLYP